MSQFISLRILASLATGRVKQAVARETPPAPEGGEGRIEGPVEREERRSSSRMRVERVYVEG